MDHLLEIARIIDGALKGDRAKVSAYAEQLVRKLQESGDKAAAERVQKTLRRTATSEVAPAIATASRLPVDSESRLELGDEEWLDAGEVSVVLDARSRRQVDEFVRFVKAADRLLASRVGIAPSMLIHGPPGVGKTELARFIAGELRLPLITARSDSLISSFLGSTAKNLRMLFDHARNRPCVLFLDEFDSVAKLRDDQHELGELKRVVVSLLQNIDALDNQTVLLAATNHHHLLDPAVWRRFAYRVEMCPPDLESRQVLFELFLDGFAPAKQELGVFASLAEGLTGADIRRVCEGAIRAAVLDDRNEIEPENVVRTIVERRLGHDADFSNTNATLVRAIHALDPKHLTLKRLAALFDTSEPTISRRLNVGESDGRKRKKVTDKGRTPAGRRPSSSSRRRRST